MKKYFIGIDVSKHTLDVAFIVNEFSSLSKPDGNNLKTQLKAFLNKCSSG